MRWPWRNGRLSKAARIAQLEAQLAAEQALVLSLQKAWHAAHESARVAGEEYRALVARMLELKREGYDPPAKSLDATTPRVQLPKEVLDSIRQVCAPGSDEWIAQTRRAEIELNEHIDPQAISKRILRGEPFRW